MFLVTSCTAKDGILIYNQNNSKINNQQIILYTTTQDYKLKDNPIEIHRSDNPKQDNLYSKNSSDFRLGCQMQSENDIKSYREVVIFSSIITLGLMAMYALVDHVNNRIPTKLESTIAAKDFNQLIKSPYIISDQSDNFKSAKEFHNSTKDNTHNLFLEVQICKYHSAKQIYNMTNDVLNEVDPAIAGEYVTPMIVSKAVLYKNIDNKPIELMNYQENIFSERYKIKDKYFIEDDNVLLKKASDKISTRVNDYIKKQIKD
jgi:hypothetical protein